MDDKIGVGFGIMLLNSQGEILLGKRHMNPEQSDFRSVGTWTFPGGKLDYGESFEDGVRRELKEETGMELGRVKLICVSNEKNEYAHYVTLGFFSEYFNGDPQVKEPDEIVEWGWFSLDDLPSPLYFPTENMIQNYLNKKFYIKRD
jgi:8-oxo-dGTP diphosphatase